MSFDLIDSGLATKANNPTTLITFFSPTLLQLSPLNWKPLRGAQRKEQIGM